MVESAGQSLIRKPTKLERHSTWSSSEQTHPDLAEKQLEAPIAALFNVGSGITKLNNEVLTSALNARLDTLKKSSPDENEEFGEWNLEEKKAAYTNAIQFVNGEKPSATPIPGLEPEKSFARVMQELTDQVWDFSQYNHKHRAETLTTGKSPDGGTRVDYKRILGVGPKTSGARVQQEQDLRLNDIRFKEMKEGIENAVNYANENFGVDIKLPFEPSAQ